jgi:ABC-2 type transport system ATP-binding protein
MAAAIGLRGVTKTFGPKVAVRDLDLEVPEGALIGVIGPNGAGKTTSIRMIMSILFPDNGEISVLGHASALDAKDRIGYLPEERGVYKKMRVGAFLSYMGKLKGIEGAENTKRVAMWLERVGLGDTAHKKCEELSKGMQQKIQFIAAVLHEPSLLILDEPFSGLDPVNMRLLRDLVLEQNKRGATILFSTHVMGSAEELCDHIVMIHDGRKVLDSNLGSIRNAHEIRALIFEPLDERADLAPLRALPGVSSVARRGASYDVQLAPGSKPSEILRHIAAAIPAARIELRRPTLEDVFVGIVTGDAQATGEEADRLRAELGADKIGAGPGTGRRN